MHMWGIPGLQAWQVVRLWKNAWDLLSPPFPLSHFLFPCDVLWWSSSLDLVKRSSGVAWQQPSAALSFQSPCSAVRLPPESRQDFPLFLHGSTFPLALPNNGNILSHSTLRVSLLQSSFFYPLRCLFINKLFPPTRCMSKLGFLSSRHNMFCLCWHLLNDSITPPCHQLRPNYFLLTNSIFTSAPHWLHYHVTINPKQWLPDMFVKFHPFITPFPNNLCMTSRLETWLVKQCWSLPFYFHLYFVIFTSQL